MVISAYQIKKVVWTRSQSKLNKIYRRIDVILSSKPLWLVTMYLIR